ncbi:hypothetical protein TeGR_g690 [Tetraparma gracilis]|uniref:EF-hand domain-containing protein n=1 Tax=Tetraparma gracilis TaxID=2962635 RepID=A0ABQ6M7N2_9STRA|nr:hypothetical protein TeGR_g690 [Tetraparma gracilis]
MGAGASSAPSAYEAAPHTRERRRSTNNALGGGTNDLILRSLAENTGFEQGELKNLQDAFVSLAEKQGNPNTITEDEFREALAVVGILESDQVILHQLFHVMDKDGANQINFKEFVTCASVMLSGSVADKLHFSFELYDSTGDGQVEMKDMKDILKHFNTTASWFGTPGITDEEVDKLVTEVFEKHDAEKNGKLSYKEFMSAVTENPILVQFLNSKGSATVKAKVMLPIWFINYDFTFSGDQKGKGKEFLSCDELGAMIMEAKKHKTCKASTVVAKTNGAADGPEEFSLHQEWHGPFDDKIFLESAFAKKIAETEGVDGKLCKWKSVDF